MNKIIPLSQNQSVARALQILESLARASEPLGVRDVGRAIGVAPSIAQRLLTTLAEAGFAEQTASRKYGIGLRAFNVGNAFLAGNVLAREALAELQQLAEVHHLNSYLGVLRGRSVVYLLACQSSGPIAIRATPGAETHLHSTALGKALLSGMAEEEARRLLGREPYARVTARSKQKFSQLAGELRLARRDGHAISDEENLTGIVAIGAPVRDAAGRVVAAISGALPKHEASRARLPALCRLVADAADRISARLGAPALRQAA